MLYRYILEREQEIRERTKRNQVMHLRYVEEKAHQDAEKKYGASKIIPARRLPLELE